MSNDTNKGYQFVIANGTVTAVVEIKNGRTKLEKMDHDETWTVNGANVIKTELDHGRMKTTTYSDVNGDGIFAKVSKVVGASPAPTDASRNHATDGDNDEDAHGGEGNDHLGNHANADDVHAGSQQNYGEAEYHIELLGVAPWTATDLM